MLTPNNRLHSHAIPVAGLATVRPLNNNNLFPVPGFINAGEA